MPLYFFSSWLHSIRAQNVSPPTGAGGCVTTCLSAKPPTDQKSPTHPDLCGGLFSTLSLLFSASYMITSNSGTNPCQLIAMSCCFGKKPKAKAAVAVPQTARPIRTIVTELSAPQTNEPELEKTLGKLFKRGTWRIERRDGKIFVWAPRQLTAVSRLTQNISLRQRFTACRALIARPQSERKRISKKPQKRGKRG